MKNALRISLLLIALLFLLAWRFAPARQASDEPEPSGEVRRPDAAVPDHTRTLRVLHGGAVEEMTMDEYLLGVLRAEMPASFELEALKAQAVAARTYTLHKMAQGAIARHPDADACDDITCCKAYETAEDAAAGWGAGALYYEEKLARAVAETDGEVIVYDGEPVLAVFFSSAAGHTQGAGEVWQTDLPYLQSVDSPEDDSLVPNYYSVVTFTAQEFRDRFLAVYPAAKLDGVKSSVINRCISSCGIQVVPRRTEISAADRSCGMTCFKACALTANSGFSFAAASAVMSLALTLPDKYSSAVTY